MGWKTKLRKEIRGEFVPKERLTVDTEDVIRLLRHAIAVTKKTLGLDQPTLLDELDRLIADHWEAIVAPKTIEDSRVKHRCMTIRRTMRGHQVLFDRPCIYGLTSLFRLLENEEMTWYSLPSITHWINTCDPETTDPILRFLRQDEEANVIVYLHTELEN